MSIILNIVLFNVIRLTAIRPNVVAFAIQFFQYIRHKEAGLGVVVANKTQQAKIECIKVCTISKIFEFRRDVLTVRQKLNRF